MGQLGTMNYSRYEGEHHGGDKIYLLDLWAECFNYAIRCQHWVAVANGQGKSDGKMEYGHSSYFATPSGVIRSTLMREFMPFFLQSCPWFFALCLMSMGLCWVEHTSVIQHGILTATQLRKCIISLTHLEYVALVTTSSYSWSMENRIWSLSCCGICWDEGSSWCCWCWCSISLSIW